MLVAVQGKDSQGKDSKHNSNPNEAANCQGSQTKIQNESPATQEKTQEAKTCNPPRPVINIVSPTTPYGYTVTKIRRVPTETTETP